MHSHPLPLSFSEIGAWASVNRICLESWQLVAITMIDDVFMGHVESPNVNAPALVATAKATPKHMHDMFAALMPKKKPEGQKRRDRKKVRR